MQQFFTEEQGQQEPQQQFVQQPQQELQQQFVQQPQQELQQQPQQQFVQQEQFNNFNASAQPQFQQMSAQQINSYTPLQDSQRVSPKVFKIALIGSSIALIGVIISLIFVIIAYSISINIRAPREYRSGLEAVLFYAICGVVIGVVFTSLTVLLRKMKSKAPAIVMIVFASIFIGMWVLGLFVFPVVAHDLHAAGSGITVEYISKIEPSFGTLITLSNFSVIPGVISLGGWSTLLVSGIMGVKIKPEELHMNKHL